MTSIVSRLLGRKPQTSKNLAAEIEAQASAIGAAREKIDDAKAAREKAIDAFDAEGHKAADEAIAEAGRDIERRECAIGKLKDAHAARLDVEAREQFRRDDEALRVEGAGLRRRLETEYEPAARTIAGLAGDLNDFAARRSRHEARGKALREPTTAGDPEDFRGASADEWSAEWPSADGTHRIGGQLADAPSGSIAWVDGKPVATRDDVQVIKRGGGGRLTPLTQSVGDLPGLRMGEKPIHVGWRLVVPDRVPLSDRL